MPPEARVRGHPIPAASPLALAFPGSAEVEAIRLSWIGLPHGPQLALSAIVPGSVYGATASWLSPLAENLYGK